MIENSEYCDCQDFQIVFVSELLNFRLWQCKKCAYGVSQPLNLPETPPVLKYHPKPIPLRFTLVDK